MAQTEIFGLPLKVIQEAPPFQGSLTSPSVFPNIVAPAGIIIWKRDIGVNNNTSKDMEKSTPYGPDDNARGYVENVATGRT